MDIIHDITMDLGGNNHGYYPLLSIDKGGKLVDNIHHLTIDRKENFMDIIHR